MNQSSNLHVFYKYTTEDQFCLVHCLKKQRTQASAPSPPSVWHLCNGTGATSRWRCFNCQENLAVSRGLRHTERCATANPPTAAPKHSPGGRQGPRQAVGARKRQKTTTWAQPQSPHGVAGKNPASPAPPQNQAFPSDPRACERAGPT